MSYTRRAIVAVGATLALTLPLAACGNSGSNGDAPQTTDGKATIAFVNWASSEKATKDNIAKVIEAFEKEHENIAIENIAVPFDQIRQQLLTKFAADDAPCVMQISQNVPFELANQDLLIDLEESGYATEEWQSEHMDSAIEASRADGKLIVVPWILSPFGLWYDRELMEEVGLDPNHPPTTFEELQAQIDQAMPQLGEGRYALGIDTTNVDVALFQFMNYFLAYGARPLYDNQPNFDSPEVIQALEFLAKQVKDKATPVGQQIRQLRELQANGKIIFRLDGPFAAGIYKSLNPELAEGNTFYERFGVTTIPVGPAGNNGPVANMHQLGISDTCAHPDEAWEFIKFLVDSDISVKEYQLPQGVVPANLEAANSDSTKEALHPEIAEAYLNEILPVMMPGPYGPNYAEATSTVLEAMQRVALQDEDAAQVAKETQAHLETVFH